MRSFVLAAALIVISSAAHATCGERGGPGCRLPNGRCASWAQASYCRTHPDTVEMQVPGLENGQTMNENLKHPLGPPPK
jgi:hypothetical protein